VERGGIEPQEARLTILPTGATSTRPLIQ